MKWDDLVKVLEVIGLPFVFVLLLAFREYLRRFFASDKDVKAIEKRLDQRVTSAEEALIEMFVDHKRNNNDRVDRVEKMTLGIQDAVARNVNQLEKVEGRVNEIDKYGTQLTRDMLGDIQEMKITLALIGEKLGVRRPSEET